MDKTYNHQEYEGQIYKLWENSGALTPKKEKGKKPFTIIMPPVNANDPLHIGHAREEATQDTLIRYHRMKGEPTLWLPGADHAGIETQFVFEKKLAKEGKSRFDFDRETLYKMIWDYVDSNKATVQKQLKQLGASCDWTRFKFTLDPEIIKIVYKTFKKLYDEGLIYRGEQIVNYCPHCGTAYSQLEVDYKEQDDYLYYLNYKAIKIATTRPETIFADVAIAINPKDEKAKKLAGKFATIPLVGRKIPIITDSLVDRNFGTGALKITPAHDPIDFEIGKKHKLPIISVIDDSGKMTNVPSTYSNLKILKAREEIVKDLEKAGLLIKKETIHHTVGHCYRCKNIIEPKILKQWFIKMNTLAASGLKAISDKKVKFTAKKYEKIAKHWLKNLHDWNISRQIVWGIRIPAWKCNKCLNWTITDGETPQKCSSCDHTTLTQDPDTFDTWFSSGQWPFATLQSISKEDFEYFYPTSVMDPSYDILPFWVIRMIMLGLFTTGDVPFKTVLIHGLVRDKFGIKISKSKGNVINPIEVTEKYGADSLRMALIWGSLVENDNSLNEDNIRGQRNFGNKLWNAARFILGERPKLTRHNKKPHSANKNDIKIYDELKKTTRLTTKYLESYKLAQATEVLYDFVWNKFANTYIESAKNSREESQDHLEYILEQTLKLLHPFMPFLTETLWQKTFSQNPKDLLILATWPK